MHTEKNLICSECKNCFQSASSLLKHFAEHALKATTIVEENIKETDDKSNILPKKTIPDLYPIIKNKTKDVTNEIVNPLTLCEVTINEEKQNEGTLDLKEKKYKCNYCERSFGWSTDLKRHILIHTGERPFKCNYCSFDFTRNFLLQKHINKFHKNKFNKTKIPDLKPIYLVLNNDKNDFDDTNDKLKHFSKNENLNVLRSSICST